MIFNKKGEEEEGLPSNALGVILAVIATAIIVGGIFLAITRIQVDNELESATTLLERIEARMNVLEEGQAVNLTLQGFKQQGTEQWYVQSFNPSTGEARPDLCTFDSCLCICYGVGREACGQRGICRIIPEQNIFVERHCTVRQNQYNREAFLDRIPQGEDPIFYDGAFWDFGMQPKPIPVPQNLFLIQIQKDNGIHITRGEEAVVEFPEQC